MKLAAFLEMTKTPDREFAEKIGVTRQALHRYQRGERVPRPEIIGRIRSLTNGAVTADDFMPAEAAA